jgi:Holliday junction DNA helicase RuvA
MIGSIRGEVLTKEENLLLVEVNGVGYLVNVPSPVADGVEPGRQIFLRTYLHVRETELTLFGFTELEEQELFELLLKVQGIGPKVALAIQSHLSAETLKQAVARDEAAALTRVPGIGKKKAQQIVFNLKGKITYDDIFDAPAPIINQGDGEVVAALTSLGYSLVEAQTALQSLPAEAKNQPIEEKIRLALSNLARL